MAFRPQCQRQRPRIPAGQRESCSLADIVERALELYATHQAQLEPARTFYRRISAEAGSDIDLETTIRAVREPHAGPEL